MSRASLLTRWINKNAAQHVPAAPTGGVTVLAGMDKQALIARYRQGRAEAAGYATVRDFCDSADWLAPLMLFNGDLKDVQRPWIVKALLATVPPGARLLEIGGGEPRVATALVELGYEVILVDPYDGAGNGPTEYQHYVKHYPSVRLVKDRFGEHLAQGQLRWTQFFRFRAGTFAAR